VAHTFGCVADAPLDEIFAWHARPGAIVRRMRRCTEVAWSG
jgi:hypothetical protein